MKLVDFVIREVAIPFKVHFKHALAARAHTRSVLFEIITDTDIRGYGEGTPREYVTGESISTTIAALQSVADDMRDMELKPSDNVIDSIVALQRDLGSVLDPHPSAKCAMELALLDAYGKMLSRPVVAFLGEPITPKFCFSGVISEGTTASVLRFAQQIKAVKIKQVKVKASTDYQADLEKIDSIRSVLEDDTQLRIDANGAWGLEETVEMIDRYGDRGITIFEQPMPASARANYPLLIKKIDQRVKIILDESVCTVDDARWFIENGAASGFNLKISKHGGLINTVAIHRLASDNGLTNQLGCHVGETSILTAAGIIFAAISDNLFAYEGAYGDFLLEHDIVRHPLQFGLYGKYRFGDLSDQPGLGIMIDPTLLDAHSLQTHHHSI
jgi:L-alanine-DL-glutamate epimerase-like enolase superfamily enzyme